VIEGPFVRFAQESARRFGVPAPDGETIKEAVKDLKSLKGTRENLSVAGPLSRAATMVKKGPSQPSPDGLK
jgi:hypothetical protein